MRLKDILLMIVLTILFGFLIFVARNYFLWWKENFELELIEERYIEPSAFVESETSTSINEEEIIKIWLTSAVKYRYTYIPKSFWEQRETIYYKGILDSFLNYSEIEKDVDYLDVMLYKVISDVRGRMQKRTVRLFGIYKMDLPEYLAVGIHEFAHFYDLYVLKKVNWVDLSDDFYKISWDNVTVIKANSEKKDFVSGYAMTNQYEDFAETYTYYVLHNKDFQEKMKNSVVLKSKYNFFKNNIFNNETFSDVELSLWQEIKDYYRDTTKIEYSLEFFLQYLKKGV